MVLINNFRDTPPKIQIPKIKNKPFKAFFTPFLLTHIAFSVKHTVLKSKTSLSNGVFNAQKNDFFTLLKTSFLESQKI